MKKNTALDWAKSIGITEQEFNNSLIELGYIIRDSNGYSRTPKGHKHSRQILKKIYWDVDAMFDVLKLIGKKSGKYFYCEKCGSYNKVNQENKSVLNCVCHNCGFPVKLGSSKADAPVNIDKRCWWYCDNCGALLNGQLGFTTEDDEWICTECGERNDISDENIIYEE